jgi:hypothetical protein
MNTTRVKTVPLLVDSLLTPPAPDATALVPAKTTALVPAAQAQDVAKAIAAIRTTTAKADTTPAPLAALFGGGFATLYFGSGIAAALTNYDPSYIGAACFTLFTAPALLCALDGAHGTLISPLKRRREARQLSRALDAEIGPVLAKGESTAGLERAWLREAASSALTDIEGDAVEAGRKRQLVSKNTAATLKRLAATPFEASPEDLASAKAMRRILDLLNETKAIESVERITYAIEKLTPEARALIAPTVRDIAAVLLADPNQKWRARRLDEALDGKRTDYTAVGIEFHPTMPNPNLIGPPSPDDIFNTQVLAMQGIIATAIASNAQLDCAASVPHTPTAEKLAAFFERHGYRCAITGESVGAKVRIYDPSKW